MKPLQNYGKIGRIHLFAAIVGAYGLILVISVGANFILLSCFRFVGLFLAGVVFLSGAHAGLVSDAKSSPLVKKFFVFDLRSQSLKSTLIAFGVQAGVSIIVPSQTLSAYESKPVVGWFGLGRALEIILSNYPLSFRVMPSSSAVVIEAPKKRRLSIQRCQFIRAKM